MSSYRSNLINPRWLSLKEAARYACIGKARLIRLAKDNSIIGFPDSTDRGDWIFDRESIDRYRLSQYEVPLIEEEARSILRSMH